MIIQREPTTVVKTLSVRTDDVAHAGIHNIANALRVTPSVVLRLAIADLLKKQEVLKAKTIEALIQNEAA